MASRDHKDYDVVMDVPVRKLKSQLSRYIREAAAGKDIVVTSRGRAMVRLVPLITEATEQTTFAGRDSCQA